MSQSKLAFQLGQVSFSGEGTEDWVAKQLDHFLSKLPELAGFAQSTEIAGSPSKKLASPPAEIGSLASYLRQKGGEKNQTKRFLITANWLRLRGEKNLRTALVSKALQDNQQKKLANASETLARNISQGFCEKNGGGFYITTEGLESLGYTGGDDFVPAEDAGDGENGSAEDNADSKAKKKKRVVRQPPPGASCRDRIKTLKADGFFKNIKTTGDIVTGLGKKGWTHNSAQVGAALTIMFNKGEIQRTKDGGAFKYFWDRD